VQPITRGANLAFAPILEQIKTQVAAQVVVLASTMPRGGIQILHATNLPETALKAYNRQFHAFGSLGWSALLTGKPARTPEVSLNNRFRDELVRPLGHEHGLVVPVDSPALAGYPGILAVYRPENEGPFGDADVAKLQEAAAELGKAIAESRVARGAQASAGLKQFIFDQAGNVLFPQGGLASAGLDERVATHLAEVARTRLAAERLDDDGPDRVLIADSRGLFATFRVAVSKSYPALSHLPVGFFSVVPEVEDYAALRPNDFGSDEELSRLVPAMKFIAENFARGPTLQEIARTVHLSPFHFHRRFSELLGITPKHYLFDCQIAHAKKLLLEGKTELADIAKVCGFAHQSHFTSRFKQATGLTPTKWRVAAVAK
jgi:AraC-like DNA-binding protein